MDVGEVYIEHNIITQYNDHIGYYRMHCFIGQTATK